MTAGDDPGTGTSVRERECITNSLEGWDTPKTTALFPFAEVFVGVRYTGVLAWDGVGCDEGTGSAEGTGCDGGGACDGGSIAPKGS